MSFAHSQGTPGAFGFGSAQGSGGGFDPAQGGSLIDLGDGFFFGAGYFANVAGGGYFGGGYF